MVLKKGPPLGSSAYTGGIGHSVIEGDCSLLSHYGAKSERHNFTSNRTTRKAAALRRNLAARGLTLQQNDHVIERGGLQPQISRKAKFLRAHQHQNAQYIAKDEERGIDDERCNNQSNYCEKKVAVVPEQSIFAAVKPLSSNSHCVSPIVPRKVVTRFARNTSLRQHFENQDQVQRNDISVLPTSVSETNIFYQTPVPPPARSSRMLTVEENNGRVESQDFLTDQSLCLPLANRSSRLVHCELAITKDIMMREQLVRQIKQTVALINSLASEFLQAQDEHKQAQATFEETTAVLLSLEPFDEFTTIAFEAAQAQRAVAEAQVGVTRTKDRVATLSNRLTYHARHMETLISGFQQSTLNVVEGILDWRQLKHRRRLLSNYQRLIRFPWRRRKSANYLLQIDEDVRSLFPSVALELLLGPEAIFNPLLLSREVIKECTISTAGKTFLTEKNFAVSNDEGLVLLEQSVSCGLNVVNMATLHEVLSSSRKPITPVSDHDRLKQCLLAINREKSLEALERQRYGEEQERIQSVYNPFSTIESAGGVEETLMSMMEIQSPNLQLLAKQLRARQEDTKRAFYPVTETQVTLVNETFRFDPKRLRLFLEKRAAQSESSSPDCKFQIVHSRGQNNKLQGKVLVRKNYEKRTKHHIARKIQRQYLAYRQRHTMLSHLTQLARKVQSSVINIQRIFRGYRAKCVFKCMRSIWQEHKQQRTAILIIVNAFRRHRRHLRYRRVMTVESIAQAQYLDMLTKKEKELDHQNTERYRRVGEERRRQRRLLLQKHQMEQRMLTSAIQLQAVVRAHLAQNQVKVLRQEKKAHVNAMTLQVMMRKFIRKRHQRLQQFRRDLDCMTQSAVRIQSIYRGYSSRKSILGQLDEKGHSILLFKDDGDGEVKNGSISRIVVTRESKTLQGNCLPLIDTSIPQFSSGKRNLKRQSVDRNRVLTNSVSLPPLHDFDGKVLSSSTSPAGTGRRHSTEMTRMELKLKEAEIGANFESPPSRRNSFLGKMRHLT